MRNGLIGLGTAMVLASTMATSACSETSDGTSAGAGGAAASTVGGSSSGGSASTAGGQTSTGSGGAAVGGSSSSVGGGTSSCTNVTPCGGDVVGTWTVASSCLKVSGQLDFTAFGLGCTSGDVTGSLQVTGTWTAKADGTFTDNTITAGSETITFGAPCLSVSGTITTCNRVGNIIVGFGYTSVTCTNAASGGGCTCDATVNQTGGLGVLGPAPATSGTYTVSGNQLTTSDGVESTPNDFCVASNKLTVTPKPGKGATLTGAIELQK